MPQILLVNPSKRKTAKRKTSKRKNPVKKRRTAKQKAATRKLVALNKRRRRPSTRRKNPVKRKKARRKPAKRRAVSRRAAPAARKRRRSRRRSNPALNVRGVQRQLTDAGIGAVGAIGLDVIQGYLPIPANLKGGIVGTLVKAGLAIGMGVIASKTKLVNYATAAKMANGALTVVLHDELKKQVATFAPGIQMGEYLGEYLDDGLGDYGAGFNPGGSYLPNNLGEGSFDIDPFNTNSFGLGEYIGDDGSSAETY